MITPKRILLATVAFFLYAIIFNPAVLVDVLNGAFMVSLWIILLTNGVSI